MTRLAITAAIALLLAACGSGGDDNEPINVAGTDGGGMTSGDTKLGCKIVIVENRMECAR